MRMVRAYFDGAWRVGLEALVGPKKIHLVHSTPWGPRVTKVDRSSYAAREIEYPVERAKRFYRAQARRRGLCTLEAKRFIKR